MLIFLTLCLPRKYKSATQIRHLEPWKIALIVLGIVAAAAITIGLLVYFLAYGKFPCLIHAKPPHPWAQVLCTSWAAGIVFSPTCAISFLDSHTLENPMTPIPFHGQHSC